MAEFPEYFEWVNLKLGRPHHPDPAKSCLVLSPVRDQKTTGYSSVYYATIATIEARMRLAQSRNGTLANIPLLSVNHMVDLASINAVGRAEEDITAVLDLARHGVEGLVSSRDYDDWRKTQGRCQGMDLYSFFYNWKSEERKRGTAYQRYHIFSHTTIENNLENELAIKLDIMKSGPVVGLEKKPITLPASAMSEGGANGDHAVSVVGFRRSDRGQLLWVVQDSHGTDCGRFGFRAVPSNEMVRFYVPII